MTFMYRDAREDFGGRRMGDGKGKVHVQGGGRWGRRASRPCNFSVVPVLETSETRRASSKQQQQQTIPAGN
jgi:hypothetical protein